jgi:N-acyl-D-amino-acid deacylase
MDVLIKGGRVLDGNGNPWFKANVAVENGKIAAVGDIGGGAETVIDAQGLIVAPGFIDIHNHSDVAFIADGRAESMVHQGVTTVITGNCGMSPFPLIGEAVETARTSYTKQFGINVDWSSHRGYEKRLKSQGISINNGVYIGHGTVREAVMGHEARAPTISEMEEMRRLVDMAMGEGCLGLSTGLGYAPGIYADTNEIVDLCRVVAAHHGIYSTHIRPATTFPHNLEEAIEIGERTGVPVQMAHIGSSTCQRLNWGRAREVTLNIIDAARARGVDFTADIYPYTISGGELTMYVPKWAQEGGKAKMNQRLADSAERENMKPEVEEMTRSRDWTQLILYKLESETYRAYAGKTVKQIADELKQDPMDSAYDIIIAEDDSVPFMGLFGLEDDIKTLIRHEAVMIGSDGTAERGSLASPVHPRNFGTFPRVLHCYVGEELLSLPEAVHKMTGMPAWRLGISDRGVIKLGAAADIVVFNPNLVRDNYTITEPPKFPEGIPYVIVNGVITVDDSKHTGARAGRIIHNPRDKTYPLC